MHKTVLGVVIGSIKKGGASEEFIPNKLSGFRELIRILSKPTFKLVGFDLHYPLFKLAFDLR